jgi:hypothetical protein
MHERDYESICLRLGVCKLLLLIRGCSGSAVVDDDQFIKETHWCCGAPKPAQRFNRVLALLGSNSIKKWSHFRGAHSLRLSGRCICSDIAIVRDIDSRERNDLKFESKSCIDLVEFAIDFGW